MSLVLSIRKLRKQRHDGAGYTLDIDSLDLMRGERLAISGPSGCGKSTALDIFAGILRPDAAERFLLCPDKNVAVDMMAAWRGKQLDKLALLRRRYLGYVLQTGGLLPFLSAGANIDLPRRCLGLPRDDSCQKLAQRLGIEHLLSMMPGKLSVGERQRVAIARALASRPSLILADEPTAALDPLKAESVMSLFAELATELGSTVVLVTHAPQLARSLGFRECPLRLIRSEEQEAGQQGGAGIRALLHVAKRAVA